MIFAETVPIPCCCCGEEAFVSGSGAEALICERCHALIVCQEGKPTRLMHETDWIIIDWNIWDLARKMGLSAQLLKKIRRQVDELTEQGGIE